MAVLRSAPDHAQKKTTHATEQDWCDVLKRREAWFDGQLDLDPERLVLIAETEASTNMARRHGRCARGSDAGGRRAAAIYTLIETCKLNDVDPRAWLADVLGRLPDYPAKRIHELLPWNWSPEIAPARAD